jgi:hypothetical protein
MKRLLWTFIAVFPLTTLADTGNSSEKLMDDWLNLEIQKGQLQSSWSQREQDLDQHLALLEIESERLKEVLTRRTEISDDVDERRSALLQQQEQLEQEQSDLKTQLEIAWRGVKALHPRLPPPLHSEWQTQLDKIIPDALNNSEMLERLLALFKMLEEFDERIALHRGVIQSPVAGNTDGAVMLVNQIYLGVSQGWYVSDDGETYGYGRATPLGWKWWHGVESEQELGESLNPETIAQVRRILENPTIADFVALPVKITQQ